MPAKILTIFLSSRNLLVSITILYMSCSSDNHCNISTIENCVAVDYGGNSILETLHYWLLY